uniref:Uncharacterized protein n=1 Tax=Anguilla anguilla TaxID=7936 RepID=A0A0E9PX44_ANGAN
MCFFSCLCYKLGLFGIKQPGFRNTCTSIIGQVFEEKSAKRVKKIFILLFSETQWGRGLFTRHDSSPFLFLIKNTGYLINERGSQNVFIRYI